MLVALAGGVGAARLLSGLVQVVDPSEVVAVVNTGDDFEIHGLRVSPDIDTVTYTLAGVYNPETGWGLAGESWRVMESLEQLGGETWFRLGDQDLATHLYRTARLSEGATLGEVTAELSARFGLRLPILPMSDDPVRTILTVTGGPPGELPAGPGSGNGLPRGGGSREIAFQDYFVRLSHSVPVERVRFDGADRARPGPGVLEALTGAERIIICPSNPILSIGPILALPEIAEVMRRRRDDAIAVSPIVGGAALKGPADRLLRELGFEASVVGVARAYADFAATLVIDEVDVALAAEVEAIGMRTLVVGTVMSTPERARALAAQLVPGPARL